MAHPDTLAHQPQLQCRPGPGGISPGGTVIHRHPLRQAITLKDINQLSLHGDTAFIGAVSQAEREAGMVVQQRQRMATATGKGKCPLKSICQSWLGALCSKRPVAGIAGRNAGQQTVAGHQLMHGAEGGQRMPAVFKPALNLAGPQRGCVAWAIRSSSVMLSSVLAGEKCGARERSIRPAVPSCNQR